MVGHFLDFLNGLIDFAGNYDFGEFRAFDCFGYFCVTDGHFLDFVFFKDYKYYPRCMSF